MSVFTFVHLADALSKETNVQHNKQFKYTITKIRK